jgi:WD40 repeat protein
MAYDGTVTMRPVSFYEAYVGSSTGITRDENGTIMPDPSVREFDYSIVFTNWYHHPEANTIDPPPNSSSIYGYDVSGQWDSSGDWILVGYEFCAAGCSYGTGRVSIYHPETGYIRELANCGGHPTCVGWLPDRVNLAELPPGRATSVLPTPQSMDYNHTFSEWGMGGLPDDATHDLVCEERLRSLVQNRSTGEVDFVIPNADPCEPIVLRNGQVVSGKPILFALSPDGRYFAMTDESAYTSLYDAETGDRIITLNFYGLGLSFSEDSRTLITVGRSATATWDVETLVAGSLTYPSEGE